MRYDLGQNERIIFVRQFFRALLCVRIRRSRPLLDQFLTLIMEFADVLLQDSNDVLLGGRIDCIKSIELGVFDVDLIPHFKDDGIKRCEIAK